MFWTVRLSIIRSLFTVHSAMVYAIHVCSQLSSRTRIESCYLCQLRSYEYEIRWWVLMTTI